MIIVYDDPAGICDIRRHYIDNDMLLMTWLMDEYGPNGFTVPTTIYKDRWAEECEIKRDELEPGYPITTDDNIIIVHTPQGGGFAVALFVGFFFSGAPSQLLAPPPDVPEFKTPTESPNNSLTGQTNIARPLQRIPDIFGKMKVFPDLIAKVWFEFVNHIKIQNEYLGIGVGSYLVEVEKTAGTLLSTIPGTLSTIFEPFTSPSELLNVTESNVVNGQDINGPNVPKVNIPRAIVRYDLNNQITSNDTAMEAFSVLLVGEQFEITEASAVAVGGLNNISFGSVNADEINSIAIDLSVLLVGEIITVSNTVTSNSIVKVAEIIDGGGGNTILKVVTSATEVPFVYASEANTSAIITNTAINFGTYTLNSYTKTDLGGGVVEYTIVVDETTFLITSDHPQQFVSTAVKSNETGPFAVPGKPDQVWFDIQMPGGLQDNGNLYTINLTLRLQQIDSGGSPIGSAEDTIIQLVDNTVDPRFYTFKVIPLVADVLYEASILRDTDNLETPGLSDKTKWSRLAGVEDITVTDFGNITSWFITTKATEQVVKIQEKKSNAIVTRKLPTYDRVNDVMFTAVNPTARMADAVVYQLTNEKMGNKPENQIDLVSLYDIQDALDADAIYGDTLGRFCYSFSNSRTSVNSEINTALRACRSFKYQEGNLVKFGRDQTNAIRTTTFSRRIKKPDSETKSTKLWKPNDFDGINLEWIDENTGDGETIVFPEASTPENPQRVEAAGVRNYNQAWNLGLILFNKLIRNNITVTTSILRDGLLVFPNARVGNVDSTRLDTQDGEIIGINGLIIETSEPIDFEGEFTSSVILRDENGDVDTPVACTARGDSINGFVLSFAPSFTIRLRGQVDDYQMGTLYHFSPNQNHAADDYLVQEISPGDDGYVQLKLTNYDVAVYVPDTTVPTPQP